jgi:hypothetical protein
MSALIWIFPILLAIAVVLGGTRAETLDRISVEAGKSFLRLTVGMTLLAVVLQVLLYAVTRLA